MTPGESVKRISKKKVNVFICIVQWILKGNFYLSKTRDKKTAKRFFKKSFAVFLKSNEKVERKNSQINKDTKLRSNFQMNNRLGRRY